MPDSFSDQQRVDLVNSICRNIDPSCRGSDYDYIIKNRLEIRPCGVWSVQAEFTGNILAMNLNAQGNIEYNQQMDAAVDQALTELESDI